MKYSEIIKAPKLVVRKQTAIAMLDHAGLFERFIRHSWLSPCDSIHQGHLFLVSDLEEATGPLKEAAITGIIAVSPPGRLGGFFVFFYTKSVGGFIFQKFCASVSVVPR